MTLEADVRAAAVDPQKLEALYQAARRQGETDTFRSTLLTLHENAPDNLLYAAWYHRLQSTTGDEAKPRRAVNWIAALPLSVLTGLIFWALSDFDRLLVAGVIPQLLLWWSPIATMSALTFLAITARQHIGRAAALGLGLLTVAAYAVLLAPTLDPRWKVQQYVIVAAIHLPLLSWIGLGISVLGLNSSTADRFAFLIKSIEVMITAGLYLAAGMAFGGLTVGMFAALGIDLPDIWLRLIAAGGFGLLPVLAVATIYQPGVPPSEQDFEQGLSRFIATMMRLLLPLTLAVLVIYCLFIPFNFRAPFEDRDLLIVYNLMLFGVLGLLVGATPLRPDDLPPSTQRWLRRGIVAAAAITALISIYALSATISRTLGGGVTINRLAIIGWNVINIGILFWLLFAQLRARPDRWIAALQGVFSRATNAYLLWALFLLLGVPLVF